MISKTLRKAVELSQKLHHVFIATADRSGTPHLAAGNLQLNSENGISMVSWYCPGTMRNLQENSKVAVVVWDPASDTGYQLLGSLEAVTDLAIMDGFDSAIEAKTPFPEIEKKLQVRVDRTLAFHRAAHSDAEE